MALRSISPSRLTLRSSPSVISKVKSLPSLTSKPPLVRPLVAPSSPARHAHAHFTSYGTKPREPDIHGFYHRPTGSWQYIVVGARFTSHTTEVPRAAAILDPVLDYDPASGRVSTATADELVDFVKGKGLRVTHILETHAHADHLSAARYLQARWQGEFDATQSSSSTSDGDEGSRRVHICIGEHIRAVQQTFLPRYAPPSAHARWDLEHAFDQLLKEGDTLLLGGEGGSRIKVLHLPGHTPDHVAYVVEGHAFVGDTFFMVSLLPSLSLLAEK